MPAVGIFLPFSPWNGASAGDVGWRELRNESSGPAFIVAQLTSFEYTDLFPRSV